MNNKEQKVETSTEAAIVGNTLLTAAAVDVSRIIDGTKVLINIIDEPPDGDGTSIYKGIATVWRIENGYIDFHDLDLIGKVSEIRRVYYKKSVSSCR